MKLLFYICTFTRCGGCQKEDAFRCFDNLLSQTHTQFLPLSCRSITTQLDFTKWPEHEIPALNFLISPLKWLNWRTESTSSRTAWLRIEILRRSPRVTDSLLFSLFDEVFITFWVLHCEMLNIAANEILGDKSSLNMSY